MPYGSRCTLRMEAQQLSRPQPSLSIIHQATICLGPGDRHVAKFVTSAWQKPLPHMRHCRFNISDQWCAQRGIVAAAEPPLHSAFASLLNPLLLLKVNRRCADESPATRYVAISYMNKLYITTIFRPCGGYSRSDYARTSTCRLSFENF